ncbi:MAG: HIT family protein [Candidatus Saccharimonadales bacterium]
MSKENCPFCNGKERIVKENEHAYALLSNPRKVPGHTLVVPKRHVDKPWELTEMELRDVFDLISYIEQKLIGQFGDGCDIRQNYRPFLQQSELKVDHIHFHVIPRTLEDYIYQVSEKYDTELFAELDAAEAKAVTAAIK